MCGTSSVCHSETGFSRQQVQVSIFTKNEFNEISSRISCAFALDVLWAVSEILASKVPETYRGSWHFMTSPHTSNLAASRCHINIKWPFVFLENTNFHKKCGGIQFNTDTNNALRKDTHTHKENESVFFVFFSFSHEEFRLKCKSALAFSENKRKTRIYLTVNLTFVKHVRLVVWGLFCVCVCVRVNLSDKTLRPSCLVFVQHFCLEHRDKKKGGGNWNVLSMTLAKQKKRKKRVDFLQSLVC